jgi:hypothetical protein
MPFGLYAEEEVGKRKSNRFSPVTEPRRRFSLISSVHTGLNDSAHTGLNESV